MNIWNKVFLGVIFIAAIGVVVLASVEMKVRSIGLQHIDALEQRVEKAKGDIARINAGTAPLKSSLEKSPSEWSFEELKNALRERYYERGRAWFGNVVSGMDERTLPPALRQVIAQVIITGPFVPSETGAETEVVVPEHLRGVVYVFEEQDGGIIGAFLGRFNVASEPELTPFRDNEGNQKTGYRVTMISADPLNDGEIEQVFDAGRSRWAIYTTSPIDRVAGVFDQLSEEEKQMIPAEILEKFQPRLMSALTDEEKEGVDSNVLALWEKIRTQMDDPEADAAQDFATMLDWLYRRQSSFLRDIELAKSDIETYKKTENQAKVENEKLKADGELEEKRVEAMNIQRDAVKAVSEQYTAEINDITLQIEKLQTLNETYVAKISEYQTKAVEEMEKQAATAGQK